MDTPPTRKTSLAFPTIGQIRKGAPKIKKEKPDGKVYEVVGPDLGEFFRVHFFPGNGGADAIFAREYKCEGTNDFKVKVIKATCTFESVWKSWECYNEAYQAGRLIAQADDEKFLRFEDPATREVLVKNGHVVGHDGRLTQEIRPFVPGEVISYSRGDRNFLLKIKPYGRLRLWLPIFQRLVTIELRTTAFYDRVNIEGQLSAIQGIADALHHGNVAGIPLLVYRKLGDVLRPNDDGKSWTRDQKWLINIEVDPEWVAEAMNKLRVNAFGINPIAALPQPQEKQVITLTTSLQSEEGDEDNDVIESSFVPETQQHPPVDPPIRKEPLPPVNPEIMPLAMAKTICLTDGRRLEQLTPQQIADELTVCNARIADGKRVHPMVIRGLNVMLDYYMGGK